MSNATYVQKGETIDYTPSGAVTAGTIVNLGAFIGIANHDIAANTLGQLTIRGVWDIVKATTTGKGCAAGVPIYWDFNNSVANFAGAGIPIGETVQACADADATMRVNVFPQTQALPNIALLAGATDAIDPHTAGNYVITTAGVDAATLAAPTAGSVASGGDDGKTIDVYSSTANAHTITATGLLETGAAAVNVATFAADAGAGLKLMAYNGKWIVKSSVGITFS